MKTIHNRLTALSCLGLGLLSILGTTSCQSTGSKEYQPKTDTVVINNMKFQPDNLEIHPGDTVVWINQGIVAHNVTEDSLQSWTSGDIHPGNSWKMVPTESFRYFCTVHPTMKGAIKLVKRQ